MRREENIGRIELFISSHQKTIVNNQPCIELGRNYHRNGEDKHEVTLNNQTGTN